jgi:hypothetical protein
MEIKIGTKTTGVARLLVFNSSFDAFSMGLHEDKLFYKRIIPSG